MSVTVAKEGNQRLGAMTREESTQCVLDIKSWFQRNGLDMDSVGCGAKSTDFQRLQKAVDVAIPEGLDILLHEVNGGLWFGEKKALSTEVRRLHYIFTTRLSEKDF